MKSHLKYGCGHEKILTFPNDNREDVFHKMSGTCPLCYFHLENDLPVNINVAKKEPFRIVTASSFYWLGKCERKIWLDWYGDKSKKVEKSDESKIATESGIKHEQKVIEQNFVNLKQIPVENWRDRVNRTLEDMKKGTKSIGQAGLEYHISSSILIRGQVDVLEKTNIPSELGSWSYYPVEIKSHSEAHRSDWLQLDVYRWLLKSIQGLEPFGELWLGPQKDIIRVEEPIIELAESINIIASKDNEPPIWFNKYCKHCDWREACAKKAINNGDIAILTGLRQTTALQMRSKGIITIQDVNSLSLRQLKTFTDVGPKTSEKLANHAKALLENKPVEICSNDDKLPILPVDFYFDIETDESSQNPWAFGIYKPETGFKLIIVNNNVQPNLPVLQTQNQDNFISRLLKLLRLKPNEISIVKNAVTNVTKLDVSIKFVPSTEKGWQEVVNNMSSSGGAIIHWGHYEATILKSWSSTNVQQIVGPNLVDAHKLFTNRFILPIPRLPDSSAGSIKSIGKWLGVKWPNNVKNGLMVGNLYNEWQESHSEEILETIVAYSKADLIGLQKAWEWLNNQYSETERFPNG